MPTPVKPYRRDMYDRVVQVTDIIETYREMAAAHTDLYMSAVSNRMNEIMKVLTIMASFFLPITFVAAIYGINFEVMPVLQWQYSYAALWTACLLIIAGLFIFFKRRGWIGDRDFLMAIRTVKGCPRRAAGPPQAGSALFLRTPEKLGFGVGLLVFEDR